MVKIISGGLKAIQQPQQPIQQPQDESVLSSLGRNIARTGERALEGAALLGSAPFTLAQFIGPKLPEGHHFGAEEVRQAVRGQAEKVIPKSWLESQNLPEEYIDMIAEELPFIAATGGAGSLGKLAGRLGFTAAGKAARISAREAGAGPLGQTIAEIAAPVGIGTLKGVTPSKLYGHLKESKKAAYEKASELSKDKLADSLEGLNKIVEKGSKYAYRFPSKHQEFLREPIGELETILKQKRLPIDRVKELKVDLNHMLGAKETPKQAKPIIKQVVGELNNIISDFSKKVPEHGAQYKYAEKLHKQLVPIEKIKEAKSYLGDFLKEASPAVKGILGIGAVGTGYLKPGTLALGAVGSQIPLYSMILRDKNAAKFASDAFLGALEKNKSLVTSSLAKLEKEVKKKEPQLSQQKQQRELKIISGGLKKV